MSKLIIVSNRLPISVSEDDSGELKTTHSNGGLATALKPIFEMHHPDWVGWAGVRRHLTREEFVALSLPENLVPINFTDRELTSFYDRYSNGVLWPILHEVQPSINLTKEDLSTTHDVIQEYAVAVVQRTDSNDVIWIHDYLLMLLPIYLRRLGVKNRIGFFLHTPFFTPEFLNQAPETELLIESLRSIDVLGVQTRRDVEAARLCGIDAQHFPIGVDFEMFDRVNADVQAIKGVTDLKNQYRGKQIIFSLSRLDYTKGVLEQIKSIELLAERRQDFVYRLNVAPSREGVLEYRELKKAIEESVRKTNLKYSKDNWQPIIYTYENFDQRQISVLYQASSIQLNVPIKDGMNLVAKEYIAACRDPKVVVLSQEAGAAEQLSEALLVRPTDTNAIVSALHQALDMSIDEKASRWEKLRNNVREENVYKWSKEFLDSLTNADSR